MKVRRKEIYEATQWFQMGDHSIVSPIPKERKGFIPVKDGATGYIDEENTHDDNGIFVHSGDWILEDQDGCYEAYHDNAFKLLFTKL